MEHSDDKAKREILKSLPKKWSDILEKTNFADLREIRFRTGQKMMLYYGSDAICCEKTLSQNDISEIFDGFCRNSVYAYLNEIQNGFITVLGGHRVGLCGECTVKDGKVTNISKIFGINIRIAREFLGCADRLMPYIKKSGAVKNTIIIAPPDCGKTTMLRDIARKLSKTEKVTVIDERDEICALWEGKAQFNIGPQTDVLSKAPKNAGVIMAIRTLSPQVIITDEVGTSDDVFALKQAIGAGCSIITSIHGYGLESIKKAKGELLSLFDVILELKKINGVPCLSRQISWSDIN